MKLIFVKRSIANNGSCWLMLKDTSIVLSRELQNSEVPRSQSLSTLGTKLNICGTLPICSLMSQVSLLKTGFRVKLLEVLNGQGRKVAGSIRMSAAKRVLSEKQKKLVETGAKYLTTNKQYMDYCT